MDFRVKAGSKLTGEVQLPGDKSISHRSIMCAALAEGTSVINGFLNGEDCLATLDAFSKMGVSIDKTDNKVVVQGVGLRGLKKPDSDLYLGNSGTSMRLMSGILAGQNFSTVLTGDRSLSARPMERVVTPLNLMGSNISTNLEGKPPIKIESSSGLNSLSYELPIASAQIKSCLMFAGLYANGPVTVTEHLRTRNHTELMFQEFGIEVEVNESSKARKITVIPPKSFLATDINVPADFSSASFFILAALITPESELLIKNVGINKTRIGFLHALRHMGANIELQNEINSLEPTADILVKTSDLKGISLNTALVANMIDEMPAFFIAAALAEGITKIKDVKELRAKESDRLQAMSEALESFGVKFHLNGDGIVINGLGKDGVFKASKISSHGDHRIAMASSIASLRAEGETTIIDCHNVNTSFPNFIDVCREVGINIAET
jgi:3-phosphoshikimate 1-carboxyvinyltransferase